VPTHLRSPSLPSTVPLDDAYVALRDLISDLMPRLQERSRVLLSDCSDAQKAQRDLEQRLRSAQTAMAEFQRSATEQLRKSDDAARDAVDRVRDEAAVRHNALANEARGRLAAVEAEKTALKQANAQHQLSEHKAQSAIAALQGDVANANRVIQHFAASCRLLYRGYHHQQRQCDGHSYQCG
jgi:hypothetical protein